MKANSEHRVHGIGLMLCAVILVVSSGCAPPTVSPAVATPTAVAPAVPTPGKSAGKLSSRLDLLARSPELRAASVEEQARALSLPAQGPGSLMFDGQNRIRVVIRMTDVAQTQVQALTNAGAVIMDVTANYRSVSAFVAPADLLAVANVAAVESIQEELTPGTGGGGGAMYPTPS